MNGRIYDPKLGRVLSPDPVTQVPEDGQYYNRYTYANNNPLKYTDPSGFALSRHIVLWDDNNGGWGAGNSGVVSQQGQSATQQNYNTPGGVTVVEQPTPSGDYSSVPNYGHSATNEVTVGDRITSSGTPSAESNPVGTQATAGEGDDDRRLTLGGSENSFFSKRLPWTKSCRVDCLTNEYGEAYLLARGLATISLKATLAAEVAEYVLEWYLPSKPLSKLNSPQTAAALRELSRINLGQKVAKFFGWPLFMFGAGFSIGANGYCIYECTETDALPERKIY
ncbi:MAG: hypothetical protein KDI24_13700 [Pseudomonadales bacterium]|nr:hypothetical protein [Pseudomonadales bacterium]